MIVEFNAALPPGDIARTLATWQDAGLRTYPPNHPGTTVFYVAGDAAAVSQALQAAGSRVIRHTAVAEPYKLAHLSARAARTVVTISGVPIGGDGVAVIAGPCAVESPAQIGAAARCAAAAGAPLLRGGAFKPRTSPYGFQGLGAPGLELLHAAAREHGLGCVSEITATEHLADGLRLLDALQVGARNMQNFRLLRALGETTKPIVLKRGMSATLDDLLLAAEHILAAGNPNVILCERGVRGFDRSTRNLLDLAAVPALKLKTHLPVIVDPSHGTGRRDLAGPMALAAAAAGADGIMLEIHPDPPSALSDGQQSMFPANFAALMPVLAQVAAATGRSLYRKASHHEPI